MKTYKGLGSIQKTEYKNSSTYLYAARRNIDLTEDIWFFMETVSAIILDISLNNFPCFQYFFNENSTSLWLYFQTLQAVL